MTSGYHRDFPVGNKLLIIITEIKHQFNGAIWNWAFTFPESGAF